MCPFPTPPLLENSQVNMNLMPRVDVLFIQPPGLTVAGTMKICGEGQNSESSMRVGFR
jgi:hypothetical protein